ncbi:unnamed protein product [Cuscuta epithymum]|uniref:Uncharacterized protein n=1 Tax=Cuscuta epithymum TaxID=186058 RepID=A0AAV0FPI5_9ASTE|nr:unnamed protein product [Cuscuta epithymum]
MQQSSSAEMDDKRLESFDAFWNALTSISSLKTLNQNLGPLNVHRFDAKADRTGKTVEGDGEERKKELSASCGSNFTKVNQTDARDLASRLETTATPPAAIAPATISGLRVQDD